MTTHLSAFLLASALTVAADEVEIVRDVPAGLPSVKRVVPLTEGPKHHFFGYYGVCPWNPSGKSLACLEVEFGDRLVRADDRAGVCLIDTATGKLTRVAETSAWNHQQGAMLNWLGEDELAFNDRIDGKLVTVILDVKTGKRRLLDRPLAALAHDGKTAISMDFDRMRRVRPVTGYAGGDEKLPVVPRPKDNGLFLYDMRTGTSKLILSVDDACRVEAVPDGLAEQPLWLEHPWYSRDDSRLFCILRGTDPKLKRLVSLPLTIKLDGGDLRSVQPWGPGGASHWDWMDDRRLVLTRATKPGAWRHLLLDVVAGGEPKELAPDVLTRDGHCTFSPDGRWMVTDSYPDEKRRQHLHVFDVKTGRAARIASFHTPAVYTGTWRCDLHPRWDRESKRVCIDSTHGGIRQVYVVELDTPKGL